MMPQSDALILRTDKRGQGMLNAQQWIRTSPSDPTERYVCRHQIRINIKPCCYEQCALPLVINYYFSCFKIYKNARRGTSKLEVIFREHANRDESFT